MQKLEGKTLDEQHRAALKNDSPLGNAPEEERTFTEKMEFASYLNRDD